MYTRYRTWGFSGQPLSWAEDCVGILYVDIHEQIIWAIFECTKVHHTFAMFRLQRVFFRQVQHLETHFTKQTKLFPFIQNWQIIKEPSVTSRSLMYYAVVAYAVVDAVFASPGVVLVVTHPGSFPLERRTWDGCLALGSCDC